LILVQALVVLAQAATGSTLLVAPPEPASPATSAAWLEEVVADTLPRDLAFLGVPAVEREDLRRLRDALAIPPVPVTRATWIRMAEAAGAGRLVLGSYETKGDALSLSLRLLDVERGTLSAPFVASGPLSSLLDLVHSVAWDMALSGETRPKRTREELLARTRDVRLEALRSYGLGLRPTEPSARVGHLKRALSLMPSYNEARLALGQIQIDTREYAAANETLSRVAASSSLARSARFLQGVALLELGRYREAAALYAELLSPDPTPAALNNHALALLRMSGPAPKASDVLRKAVEMAPESADLPFNLGFALLVEGNAEAAAFWLKGLVREEPTDTHARVVLAWALRRAGRDAEADEIWTRLVALAPSYEPLAAPDLQRRFERIQSSERLLLLDRDRRTDAELVAVHLGRGDKLLAAGDLDAALRELTQAAYLDPYGPRTHVLLSRVHAARGEPDKAVAELRMSLWCREDAAVRGELLALLQSLGRAAEARKEAERGLAPEPGEPSPPVPPRLQ
jgi:tetratricopeptide (TPR) repeat protein